MKQLGTLVEDINNLVTEGFLGRAEWTSVLGQEIAEKVAKKFSLEERRGTHYLRPSNVGEVCDRKTWYGVHDAPEEELPPEARVKFLFGDILESLLLALAEAAGHTVEARQAEVSLHGVTGHIDCIIDGVLVDVKSASTYSFQKFANHLSKSEDSFGYLSQLGFYLEGLQNDSRLLDKDHAAFLVIDKTLGKLTLDIHDRVPRDWQERIHDKKKMLDNPAVPRRGYYPEPDGKSGNLKLGLACSYCNFRKTCYPGLRTFIYSTGPRYLSHVARQPDVPEVSS